MENNEKDENCADLSSVSILNEASILQTIRSRFLHGRIYTGMHPLIISVNPYKEVEDLYDVSVYSKLPESERRVHSFSVGETALSGVSAIHQSIIVRGESGAGKTEACKRILAYLVAQSSSRFAGTRNDICGKLLACSPILESFGNSRTLHNDNSSRFGKYLKVLFSPDSGERCKGKICGAIISHYLLEKSRVVHQSAQERNYHVFYQLLLGSNPDQMNFLQLSLDEPYNYLRNGCREMQLENDVEGYSQLISAMKSVGISEPARLDVTSTVALVLHLGNLRFLPRGTDIEAGCRCEVKNSKAYDFVSEFLDLPDLDRHLTTRTLTSPGKRGSVIEMQLSVDKAVANSSALAKEIYDRLFSWLVQQCNANLSGLMTARGGNYIALLDLFGFEVFPVNCFEQFCINYCNEKLQNLFNNSLVNWELEGYRNEGIPLDSVTFHNNDNCVELLEGENGIFRILDEMCQLGRIQKSADEECLSMLQQMESIYANRNPHISFGPLRVGNTGGGTARQSSIGRTKFVIRHFAGSVEYNASAFISKNSDRLESGLLEILQTCNNGFIRDLFQNSPPTSEDQDALAGYRPASVTNRPTSIRPRAAQTIGSRFRTQLRDLLAECQSTSIQYIKCIKPNSFKRPDLFDDDLVHAQLAYSGVYEVVRIRHSGFPIRESWHNLHKFAVQEKLYDIIMPRHALVANLSGALRAPHYVRMLFDRVALPFGSWQEGRTKVFLKKDVLQKMVDRRQDILATRLQKRWRGIRGRTSASTLRISTQRIWRFCKIWLHLHRYRRSIDGIAKFQTHWRSNRGRRQVLRLLTNRWLGRWKAAWKEQMQWRLDDAVDCLKVFLGKVTWRRKLKLLHALVLRLKASFWMWRERGHFRRLRSSTVLIQRNWRVRLFNITIDRRIQESAEAARRRGLSRAVRLVLNAGRKVLLQRVQSQLFEIAKTGDAEHMKSFFAGLKTISLRIRRGFGCMENLLALRDRSQRYLTLLGAAVESRSFPLVEFLVIMGADVEALDSSRQTVLHKAVLGGDKNMRIIRYLLRICPQLVSARDSNGATAADLVRQKRGTRSFSSASINSSTSSYTEVSTRFDKINEALRRVLSELQTEQDRNEGCCLYSPVQIADNGRPTGSHQRINSKSFALRRNSSIFNKSVALVPNGPRLLSLEERRKKAKELRDRKDYSFASPTPLQSVKSSITGGDGTGNVAVAKQDQSSRSSPLVVSDGNCAVDWKSPRSSPEKRLHGRHHPPVEEGMSKWHENSSSEQVTMSVLSIDELMSELNDATNETVGNGPSICVGLRKSAVVHPDIFMTETGEWVVETDFVRQASASSFRTSAKFPTIRKVSSYEALDAKFEELESNTEHCSALGSAFEERAAARSQLCQLLDDIFVDESDSAIKDTFIEDSVLSAKADWLEALNQPQFTYGEEILVAKLPPPFESDPEKRREVRRQRIFAAREKKH